jgi:hypothetical protein
MKISEYVRDYTDHARPITTRNIFSEIKELIEEVIKMNKDGIVEEFGDVFHFLQLWLHAKFGLNGEIWPVTNLSVKKFMDRKTVWNKIYVHVGLPENISGYVGNYNKLEKVVAHLGRLGVGREQSASAYDKIVQKGSGL